MFIRTSKTQRGWAEKSKLFRERQFSSTYHTRQASVAASSTQPFTTKRKPNEIVINGISSKDLSDPMKINDVRLEHF